MTAIDQFAARVPKGSENKKYDVCVQFKNDEHTFFVINHTPEALDTWLNKLHQKVKDRTAIAFELKKCPVVYTLQKPPFYYCLSCTRVILARYQQTFWPSGAWDDLRMSSWH